MKHHLIPLLPVLLFGAARPSVSAAAENAAQGIPLPTDAPKPRTPEETARSFRLPDGFRMEVIASEPLIASPSAVCWDEHGTLFVSELHGYNLEGQLDVEELNKTGQLDTQVRRVQADEKYKAAAKPGTYGVIKRLRDTDGDGRMDRADVWAKDMPPAYGLVAARGGIIVTAAPDILYFADRDNDGVAETREVLFTGFKAGALERGINAPMWWVDGWIYAGRGHGGGIISGPHAPDTIYLPDTDFRFRADGTEMEPLTGSTLTLGFAMTEAGDRIVCATTTPGIFIAPLPSQYLARNPDSAVPAISVPIGERRAWQISAPHPWRQKRADDAAYSEFYRKRYGAAEAEAGGWFTSACGAMVYQDDVLPGLHGQYFVCEPSGNLIHRSNIVSDGSALQLQRVPGETKSEFAASDDGWCHPIRLQHGPDGCLWVVDYYREIIEDYSAIPRHLQQQYGLYAGHDRGRIYRLTHRDAQRAPAADMSSLSVVELARATASPLQWRRETALRLLAERRDAMTAAPVLRQQLAEKTATDSAIITALHALNQLYVLTPRDVAQFVSHPSPAVRRHALQLADRWFYKKEGQALLAAAVDAAAVEKDDSVAIQFALSLGEARDPRAFAMLARYARERLKVRWMDTALLSSLQWRCSDMLAELLNDAEPPQQFIDQLARSIASRRDEAELARVLAVICAATPAQQVSILTSLANGRANAARNPLAAPTAVRQLAVLAASSAAEVRDAARALEATFVPLPPGKGAPPNLAPPVVAVSDATFRAFTAALKGPRDPKRGHQIFLQACATCHRVGAEGQHFGPDLMGELGVAEETLVRHLLLPSERIRPGFETTLVDTQAGASLAGLLVEDGATSLSLRLPGGVEQTVLRKDVKGIRRAAVSMMPSFAESITPPDVASLLEWLRGNLKPRDPSRFILFDEDSEFASLLNRGAGRAAVVTARPFSGAVCLSMKPLQRFNPNLPSWNFRIVEKPSADGEFRFLHVAWRATGAGAMIELASNGKWPDPRDSKRRFFAGKNTSEWQATQVSPEAPATWKEEVIDLWKNSGDFTLTGIAPTALGGIAFFDNLELRQSDPASIAPASP